MAAAAGQGKRRAAPPRPARPPGRALLARRAGRGPAARVSPPEHVRSQASRAAARRNLGDFRKGEAPFTSKEFPAQRPHPGEDPSRWTP